MPVESIGRDQTKTQDPAWLAAEAAPALLANPAGAFASSLSTDDLIDRICADLHEVICRQTGATLPYSETLPAYRSELKRSALLIVVNRIEVIECAAELAGR